MLQNAQLERLIDVKKIYHLFFSVRKKKTTFYFRYSTNHSSRQILDNILWSLARGYLFMPGGYLINKGHETVSLLLSM